MHLSIPTWNRDKVAAAGVAMKRRIFGEGAERMVNKFRFLDRRNRFLETKLVAKESRFIEEKEGALDIAGRMKYHEVFCKTQMQAAELAHKFNEFLEMLPTTNARTPRIKFIDCAVYCLTEPDGQVIGVLVEKMLNPSKYMKWNSNGGYVDKVVLGASSGVGKEGKDGFPGGAGAMQAIAESVEECDPESDKENGGDLAEEVTANGAVLGCTGSGAHVHPSLTRPIIDADIPQAFTHFTFRYTGRKKMVAPLLYVTLNSNLRLDHANNISQGLRFARGLGHLNFTACVRVDRPCHSLSVNFFLIVPNVDKFGKTRSKRGRKNVFGRTDRGTEGAQGNLFPFLNYHWQG